MTAPLRSPVDVWAGVPALGGSHTGSRSRRKPRIARLLYGEPGSLREGTKVDLRPDDRPQPRRLRRIQEPDETVKPVRVRQRHRVHAPAAGRDDQVLEPARAPAERIIRITFRWTKRTASPECGEGGANDKIGSHCILRCARLSGRMVPTSHLPD